MPKLRETRLDENRQLIEQAALSLLPSMYSMKTNIRDIAEAASVSTGNDLHLLHPSKEALFTSLVHKP